MDGWMDGWMEGGRDEHSSLVASSHRMRVGLWRERVHALHNRAARDGPMGFAAPSSSGGTSGIAHVRPVATVRLDLYMRMWSAAVSPGRFGALRARLRAGGGLGCQTRMSPMQARAGRARV